MVALWVDGLDQKEISVKLEFSEPSVSGKLKAERAKNADLVTLRANNEALKKAGVGVLDSTRAAKVLSKIEDAGVALKTKDLVGAEKLFGEYGDRMVDAIGAGETIMALEKSEGKPFPELAAEASRLQTELPETRRKLGELRKEVETKRNELGDVKEYEALRKEARYPAYKREGHERVHILPPPVGRARLPPRDGHRVRHRAQEGGTLHRRGCHGAGARS